MKTICLYFEIHQNIHLKRYRFFDIGTDHYYYDDYENERSITDTVEHSYVPALQTLLQMAKENQGYFKVAFSISGCAIELLENYAPSVIELLQELNDTGCVEFLAEPYSHGLSSLANEETFKEESLRMSKKIQELFGQEPKVFRNSSLIYSDDIGSTVASMGFKGMITEGAKHILGWKSPHFVYHCAQNPNLKLLLRDYKLSDDIGLRFSNKSWSEYPLFADTYMDWIASEPEEEQVINIFHWRWPIRFLGWTRKETSVAGWATGCSARRSTSCIVWPTVCGFAMTAGFSKTGIICKSATTSVS